MKRELYDHVAEIAVSYHPAVSSKPIIKSPLDAYVELVDFFPTDTIALQERMVAMYLNRSCRVLGIHTHSVGGITGTIVDVRLLLSVGLKIAATNIILCHNHPSGNLTPSSNDLAITLKVKEACKLVDMSLNDHLIISPEGKYFSMENAGYL